MKGQNYILDNQVDYKLLLNSELFKNGYLKSVAELKNIKLNKLENDEQKLAFFINILLKQHSSFKSIVFKSLTKFFHMYTMHFQFMELQNCIQS